MTRKADLETVRSAFRIAGLADGGIESFDDVGLELLWQIAEIRAQQERKPHTEAEVQVLLNMCDPHYSRKAQEKAIRRILKVPAP